MLAAVSTSSDAAKRNDADHTIGVSASGGSVSGSGGSRARDQAALTILLLRMQRVQASVWPGVPFTTACTRWRLGSCHLRALRLE